VRNNFRVSVCIPARNEENTVGEIVGAIVSELCSGTHPLVDELIVMDDGSTDATAKVARLAGAKVVDVASVLVEHGPGKGKGNALWKSVAASTGDIIVWCDADLVNFTPRFIELLVGPFLVDPSVMLVKGHYERVADAHGVGGGRNTELVARPMLSLLFPELASIRQPLGGEYAVRREAVEAVPFVQGYGVELGLLIDISQRYGDRAVQEVDLGTRVHRHRSLADLAPQATEIMHVMLRRAGVGAERLPQSVALILPNGEFHAVTTDERPPLAEIVWQRP
jgi:glucosyl-3-phosphoglycerate synthase